MQRVQNTNQPKPAPDTDVYYKGRKIPKAYMDVAQGMETQFTNYMLEEMNKSNLSEEEDSSATQYYKSLLNQERAQIMAAAEGRLGIKDVVLDQILPKQVPLPQNNQISMNAYKAVSKQGGENE